MTTILSVSFSLSIESFGFFREALLEGCVTNFTLQEFLEFAIIRFFGIEAERVLALFFEFRIVAEEIPVTAFDSEFSSVWLLPMPLRIPWLMQGA